MGTPYWSEDRCRRASESISPPIVEPSLHRDEQLRGLAILIEAHGQVPPRAGDIDLCVASAACRQAPGASASE